jgi:hypothetical protein
LESETGNPDPAPARAGFFMLIPKPDAAFQDGGAIATQGVSTYI